MKSKIFKILGVIAVVAMIAAALVAPAAALSGVNLAVSTAVIGATPTTTVTFTLGATQAAATNAFVVTFSSGWTIPAGAIACTISTSNGIGSTAISNITPNATAVGQVITIDTTPAAVGPIGAGAIVQLTFTTITNPTTIGSYGCTVSSAAETTAVASNTITTTTPTIVPVPGTITVWNSGGVELAQTTDFNVALAAVTAGGTIKLTAGTYNTAFTSANLDLSMTIQGTDPSAANVILMSTVPWTLSGATVVINNVTIDGSSSPVTPTYGSAKLTIANANTSGTDAISGCNIQNGALTVNDTGTATVCTLSKDVFTVATGAYTGLVATTPVTATGCTFNVAGTSTGITAAASLTVTGSTFTGVAETTDTYLGNGILVTGGTGSAISASTFTGLSTAFTVSNAAAMATFNGNTVTNCGEASPPAVTATSAIVITAAAANGVNIYGNTITKSTNYVISVATGQDGNVNFYQNTLTGNANIATNGDLSNTLNLIRNWWGSVANIPANVTVATGLTAGLQFTPALTVAPTAAAFSITPAGSTASALSASASVGVNINNVSEAAEWGATALSASPVSTALPSGYTAVKYWDVYGQSLAGAAITDGATVDFYGTTASPVVNTPTSMSAVLFYNPTTGSWVVVPNDMINAYGNYVEIYVGTTANAGVSQAEFDGTPFVLATQTIALGTITPPTAALYPVNGATGVPVSGITFTWPAVTASGLTVTYQFAIAQASANTSANEFAILDYSDNASTNAEVSQETFQYNTVYWWEVRAITMNASGGVAATGPWTVSMFTTMPMPATTTSTAPAITVTNTVNTITVTQPITTVQSTVTSVVITQTTGTSSAAIPSYLLWVVIVVGAILVIAVIVLIVRTRRIP